MVKNEMFLRFYGQTDEKIDECAEKIKQAAPGVVGVRKKPITKSMNPVLPAGNNVEVWLAFDTKKHLLEFHGSQTMLRIYREYATPEKLPVVLRSKEDLAFTF